MIPPPPPPPPPPRYRLQTLGDIRLTGEAGELLKGRRKDLLLLAVIAMRAPRRLSRAALVNLLWSESDARHGRLSLRQGLLKLRRTLPGALAVDAEGVDAKPETLDLDAREFHRLVGRGHYREAVELWSGEFLPGAESLGGIALREWLEEERNRLRSLLGWALAQLVRDLENAGAFAESAALTARWVDACPEDDAAHVARVRLLRLAGRYEEALSHFRAYDTHLNTLGVGSDLQWRELGKALERDASRGRSRERHPFPHGDPDFVGRHDVLIQLDDLWQKAEDTGGLAWIEGEQGMGVSRVLEFFAARIRRTTQNAVILRCRERPGERDVEFSAASDLLTGLRDEPGVAGVPGESLAVLTGIAPWIRTRFRGLDSAEAAEPREVARAVVAVVTAVAEDSPVLVCADDFARLDRSTREVVLRLAGRTIPNVLVMAGGVVGDVDERPELTSLLRAPGTARIRLQPLSRGDLRLLGRSVVGGDPDSSDTLLDRVVEESRGNPSFTIDILRALVECKWLIQDGEGNWRRVGQSTAIAGAGSAGTDHTVATARPLPLPPLLREGIERELASLGCASRKVLDTLVVLGGAASLDPLASAAGMRVADVRSALDDLDRRRMVGSDAPDSDRYFVRGELLLRVASEALSAEGREEIEKRIRDVTRTGPSRGDWRRVRNRYALALAASLLLVATAVGGTLGARRRTPPLVSPRTVAVFPFSVRSPGGLTYLGEGVVDLLSTALDGAGDLRTVDPRQTLNAVAIAPAPDVARRAARRLGAGWFLVGAVVDVEGMVQLSASLYSTARPLEPPIRFTATGSVTHLVRLVDTLARGVFTAGIESAGLSLGNGTAGGSGGDLRVPPRAPATNQLTSLASLSTSSLPALKAYLEGEAAFRRGAYGAAVDAFERAAALDTAFALAYYRASVAADWVLQPGEAPRLAELAFRHRDRLAPRARGVLTALRASRHGDFMEATQQLRSVISDRPGDAEAWFELGELLTHHGPFYGSPVTVARPAFARALELDAGDIHALIHLARIAALEGRTEELDSLLRMGERMGSQNDRPVELSLLRAFVWNDTARQAKIEERLRHDEADVTNPVWNAAMFAENFPGAERLSRILLSPGRGRDWNGVGFRYLALLRAAQGKLSAVTPVLEEYRAIDQSSALEYAAYLSLLPYPPRLGSLADQRRQAALIDAGNRHVRHADDFVSVHDTIHPLIREYLLGRLAVKLRDEVALARHAERLARSRGAGSVHRTLAASLLHSLRAHAAAERGETTGALAQLDSATLRTWHAWRYRSPFYAQPHDRWLRAQLLQQLGRYDDALRWYQTFDGATLFDALYLAPSHLRRAEILASRGQCAEASQHRRRAGRVWGAGSPEAVALARHTQFCEQR